MHYPLRQVCALESTGIQLDFLFHFQYYKTQEMAIGNLRFYYPIDHPLQMCILHYKSGNITNNTYSIDSNTQTGVYRTSKIRPSGILLKLVIIQICRSHQTGGRGQSVG